MALTKKHFETMARSIRNELEEANHYPNDRLNRRHVILNLTDAFCAMAEAENPRFDRDRFKAACGFRET